MPCVPGSLSWAEQNTPPKVKVLLLRVSFSGTHLPLGGTRLKLDVSEQTGGQRF